MPEIDALAGSQLGAYRLLRCLGHGTHTAVYTSTDGEGAPWAVKAIDAAIEPPDSLLTRLRMDASRMAELGDETIVPVGAPDVEGELVYAASPMIPGPPLAELMAGGPMDTEVAWGVLSSLAGALDRARECGLACLVLKPSNVVIDSARRARLVEFGLGARLVGPMALASPGYRLRYPQYLAPEQIEGRPADSRSDVYALGVLVFELLTARPLFAAPSVAEVLRDAKLAPPPSAHALNPALPAEIDAVFGRALAKDPDARPPTAWTLLDDLIGLDGAE